MRPERREIVRRLTTVGLTLAFGVGSIALMRFVAQAVAGTCSGSSTRPAVGRIERGANAPKKYDLGALVKEEARYSVLGSAGRRYEVTLLMPLDMAVRQKASEALSDGWKPVKEPQGRLRALLRDRGSRLYETPDGRMVLQTFGIVSESETAMTVVELPSLDTLLEPYRGNTGLAAEELTAVDATDFFQADAEKIRMQLPVIVGEVLVGTPLFTTLLAHGEGHVLLVTAVCPGTVTAAEFEFRRLMAAKGWRRIEGNVDNYYIRDNLSLNASFAVDSKLKGKAVAAYRISDDEVRINQQRSE